MVVCKILQQLNHQSWNQNQRGVIHDVHGLWIYGNGNTSVSGNSDVGLGASVTSIKAYVNHCGNQGNIQMEARWGSQGFIHFIIDYADGLLLIAAKDDLYTYGGLNIIYFYKPTTNASDDRLKENDELI